MRVVSFTEARNGLKAVLDSVVNDADTTVITRRDSEDAVVMSLDYYNSLMETVYLLRSPANAEHLAKSIDQNKKEGERIFYLSPKGKKLDQKLALELSREKSVSLICGHFEGVDERILSTRNIEELSIGDFILSGGETASFVILDSILRLLPGVLGNEQSKTEESFENGLLEYPQYTKPQIWEEKSVPEVLLSGDHNKIKDWRLSQSEAITRDRRPDLWEKYKKN